MSFLLVMPANLCQNDNRLRCHRRQEVIVIESQRDCFRRTLLGIRGQFVLEDITGTPPAAPPPGVEAIQ